MLLAYLLAAATISPFTSAGPNPEHFVHLEKRTTLGTCQQNVTTRVWDTCVGILTRYGVSIGDFVSWNTGVSNTCAGFVPGNTYCLYKSILPTVSTDGSCGTSPTTNITTTCVGSKFGNCCSANGYCGSTSAYCGIGSCQSGACTGSQYYSTDGRCGVDNGGRICGGQWGPCCSQAGYCGSTADYCQVPNCQSGACTGGSSSSSRASAAATTSSTPLPSPFSVSTDGTCGYVKKYNCTGSNFGLCCSAAGWCGSSFFHCDPTMRCQTAYGTCYDTKSPGGPFN